jgi:hypothetical protein
MNAASARAPGRAQTRDHSPGLLRRVGLMSPGLAEQVTEWFVSNATGPTDAVLRSYAALERDTARLFDIVQRCWAW